MRLRALAIGLCGLAAAALLAGHGGASAEGGDEDPFRRDVAPFLARWCFECHSGERKENDLDLSKLGAGSDPDVLREVRRKLRRREMPPKKAPQPPAEDVARVVAWIDSVPDGAGAGDPGRVTIRRLSRTQYRNTVRDLLGVAFDAEAKLPPDDVGLGFDNIGDVLTMPPALFEKYLAAAETVASLAIVDTSLEQPASCRMAAPQGGWIELRSGRSMVAELVVPRAGEYLVRTRAFREPEDEEPVRMALHVDGSVDRVFDVTTLRAKPEVSEARFKVGAGTRRVSVGYVEDARRPGEPDPALRNRRLFVEWLELEGPVDVRPATEFQKRLLEGGETRPRDAAYAQDLVRRLASRAFRRPATDDETARFASLVTLAQREGRSFEAGLQLALTSILAAPQFLFRVETDPLPDDPSARHDLTGHELATRLSYLLWSSLPDDQLAALAAKGSLADPEVLGAETRRMLRDPRASALSSDFGSQWLELRRLDTAAPDPARFPRFDDALRASMRRETELFLEAVRAEGRPLRELLGADWTFLDARLARHYGVPGVEGDAFRRVKLPGPRGGGLLTHASILTFTSNPTRTSPTKRGKFLLDALLGEPPPPPPPGVGAFDESEAAAKAATLRERLARHRADPKCVGCHTRMDALGFALENYDPVGTWRERDGDRPVDAVGNLPDGREITGPAELRAVLLADDALVRALAEKLFVYGVGRRPGALDRRALDRLAASLPGLDATFEDVVLGVVRMDAFRRRRGEGK